MEIARAAPDDYASILELQNANYLSNLSVEEREGGFLSAQFALSQIASIADDLGILVASERGELIGYVCVHRIDMTPLPPVVEAMARCARTATHRGKALAAARLFVYGPVCIARAHRGRGLLRKLYSAVSAEMAGRFEFGVTLVSESNPRSLRAHVDGLGMEDVQLFEHGGLVYHLLAFAVR